MKTITKVQFEKELNERISMTVNAMFDNEAWREIFSHLSNEQVIETIAIAFLLTNVQKGYEQAFVNAVMKINK